MILHKGNDANIVSLGSRVFTMICVGAKLVWQAANFFTFDRGTFRTADGDIFNCKDE